MAREGEVALSGWWGTSDEGGKNSWWHFITQARGHADISTNTLNVPSKSDRFMFTDAVFEIFVHSPDSEWLPLATSTARRRSPQSTWRYQSIGPLRYRPTTESAVKSNLPSSLPSCSPAIENSFLSEWDRQPQPLNQKCCEASRSMRTHFSAGLDAKNSKATRNRTRLRRDNHLQGKGFQSSLCDHRIAFRLLCSCLLGRVQSEARISISEGARLAYCFSRRRRATASSACPKMVLRRSGQCYDISTVRTTLSNPATTTSTASTKTQGQLSMTKSSDHHHPSNWSATHPCII